MKDFGRELRKARNGKGLTLKQVAGKSGVSVNTVQGWETGRISPNLGSVEWVLEAMGMELEIVDKEPRARVLTEDEVCRLHGAAWAEQWLREDDESDGGFFLEPVGVCAGNLITEEGCYTTVDMLVERYNKRYGVRLWTAKPTETQQREAAWDVQD